MSANEQSGRDRAVAADTMPAEANAPTNAGAEVAPGIVLDPETRQPIESPPGAEAPPAAPPEMLGLSPDTGRAPGAAGRMDAAQDDTALAQPDDLTGPPS